MLAVGDRLPDFSATGVKPKFSADSEGGVSAFAELTQESFPGQWKLIHFYAKDFSAPDAAALAEFARLAGEFAGRNAVIMSGSSDNEFCKIAWRRDEPKLKAYPAWQFADMTGALIDGLGVRSPEGAAIPAAFIVDPQNVIQHVCASAAGAALNPGDLLRALDALQAD